MPSEVLAPKLSALHKAFERKDLTVVALYMETCDGVPDHADEMRRQIGKHRIEHPVLDAEAGPIEDPTRKRFPWAPHAVVVDGEGRILRTYGRMPRMRTLKEDLETLVATGLFPARPDDRWREFERNAWVDVRIEGRGRPRTERRVLRQVGPDGVTLRAGENVRKLPRENLDGTDRAFRRTELDPQKVEVDGRTRTARVFSSTWTRAGASFAERLWIADGTLVRRERTETRKDGSRVTRSERLRKWEEKRVVGDRELACRLVETTVTWDGGRTDERVWICEAVPGHVVKLVRVDAVGGETSTETTTVTAFGLR